MKARGMGNNFHNLTTFFHNSATYSNKIVIVRLTVSFFSLDSSLIKLKYEY